MLNGQKIIVVMRAYNAAKTLRQTYAEIPFEVILVEEDASSINFRGRSGTDVACFA